MSYVIGLHDAVYSETLQTRSIEYAGEVWKNNNVSFRLQQLCTKQERKGKRLKKKQVLETRRCVIERRVRWMDG